MLEPELYVIGIIAEKMDNHMSEDDKKYGKYTFANGDIYEGQWQDGKMHGQGKYTFVSGAIYEGQWRDGKMQTHG